MSKQADKTNKPAPPKAAKPQAPHIQPTPVDSHLLQLAREDPARLTPTQRTHLQRTLGNQALSRLVSNPSSVIGNRSSENGKQSPISNLQSPFPIQPKLTVNAVGDKYEQEADAVAKEVVQKLNAPQPDAAAGAPTAPPTHAQRQTEEEEPIAQRIQRQATPDAVAGVPTVPPTLQRQEVPEEELQLQRQETEDEELQLQRQALEEEEPQELAMLQRQAAPEEEEIQLQRQALEEEDPAQIAMTQRQPQDFTHGGPVDSHIEAQINQSRGGGQPMEDSIRQPMEQAFGADFSDVRIHTDAQAHNLNEAIQARAFTTGNDIYFKEGEYSPSNTAGQELLAHEITHVIQQGKTKNENIANRETSTNDISNQKFIQEITKHLEGMPNPKDSKDNFDRVTSILNFFLTSLNVPGRAAVNVPIIIKKISDGEYFSAAKSLISLAGSASVALSKVMIAMRVGMSSSMGALSTSAMTGPMLGMLGELAGPIAMTLAVGYGIYDIPNNVNSEIGKWFYVADLSGLLTSWIFAVPSISPHQHLIDKAKDDYHSDLFYYEEFGVLFNRSALQTKLESLRKARLDSERAWKKEIKSTPGLQRAIRKIHEDNPVHFWLEFAEQLENRNPSKQQYSLIFTKDIIKKLA